MIAMTMQMMATVTVIKMALIGPKMIVRSMKMMLRDNHSAKNDMDEAEYDRKIDENDDDMLLEPIKRAASQTAPRVTSVFLMQK